ncbi:MAG TPA: DEAD/DEAH box helicase [Polyangia bacterium]|jgi:superfamily II DNA/RNA helicase|nr:DEAD/DEAH box helicase [Polyangia bacterium]
MTTPMPSAADIEYAFYDKFFFSKNLEPYPVQERAFEHIFRGDSVLITVPTGTGKTLMAKAALQKALMLGQTAVYTTPLRALTEEKFRELCDDFGEDKVGFATGDYKVRPEAPIQVIVAEILWNRIFGDRIGRPADVVVMDEGHYFNDPERGYVWEQSIIGLDPRTQLVILSATVGEPERFCQWVYVTRRVEMHLVQSTERKVPLYHEYRETYLIDVVKQLQHAGETPAIIFTFGREACFERARLLKSCSRFTTDEERQRIEELAHPVLLDRGLGRDFRPLLIHGIGIHHAGILPRYKQLVEQLALERLIKFVVSTETISAGINLPAKRVVFPELRKWAGGKARILSSAEYHQMAGRAGRPQFDTEGIAITLAPEEVVQEIRKELKDAQRGRFTVDEAKIRKGAYARARTAAQQAGDVTWDEDAHKRLVSGMPAPLRSQTRITAEQILAIGLPDLTTEPIEREQGGAGEAGGANPAEAAPASTGGTGSAQAEEGLPPAFHLNVRTVIENLFLPDRERVASRKRLAQVTDNLVALGVVDEHGVQQKGQLINQLRGIDGLFVFYCLTSRDLHYEECRELVEYLVDHDVIQKLLNRKDDEAKREWIRNRLRERRREESQVTWEDVEEEYEREHPRELTPIEQLHSDFLKQLPHQELHKGKLRKNIWATMETEQLSFLDFTERQHLQTEEGSLFSYLVRVMKVAKMLYEAAQLDEFQAIEEGVRRCLAEVDPRVLEEAGKG